MLETWWEKVGKMLDMAGKWLENGWKMVGTLPVDLEVNLLDGSSNTTLSTAMRMFGPNQPKLKSIIIYRVSKIGPRIAPWVTVPCWFGLDALQFFRNI